MRPSFDRSTFDMVLMPKIQDVEKGKEGEKRTSLDEKAFFRVRVTQPFWGGKVEEAEAVGGTKQR